MIVQLGAVVENGEFFVVAVGVAEEAVRAEHVGGEIASSLETSLSFCMDAAVAVFSASYCGAQCHLFQLLCPWRCCLLRLPHPGNQGYQAGMVHLICPLDLPQTVQMLAL